MATTRLLRTSTSKPIHLPPSSSFTIYARFQSKATLKSTKGEIRKPPVAMKAAASMPATDHIFTSISPPPPLLPHRSSHFLAALLLTIRNVIMQRSKLQPQILIEKAIVDCRFFTLFAVAGSLLGSVLCFVEGCVLIFESYIHYYAHSLSQRLEQGHDLVHLLIEAIDMFLVGTALLVFGAGLYMMFVGPKTTNKEKKPWLGGSNLLGLFHMKSEAEWVGMESMGEAKSKIGHAVMMILQVGLLDKFKHIPLLTGLDLACFAAALLTSSASIFLLSKLHPFN